MINQAEYTQKEVNNNKKFRIAAKKIYLTYSQVDESLTAQYILEQIKQKTMKPFFDYVIAKECHQDGNFHFHVLLLFQKKVNFTNAKVLDIEFQDKIYHGNYQTVRSLEHVLYYICKNEQYISNLNNFVDGRILSLTEMLIKDVHKLGKEKALIKHTQEFPNKALSNLSLVSVNSYFKQLEQLNNSLQVDHVETPFKLEDFHLSEKLKEWIDNPAGRTLLLVGNSGVGKSSLIYAFVTEKNYKLLIVNHREDFSRLNDVHDTIFMDDACVQGMTEAQLLAFVDNKNQKTMRVLYTSKRKKKNLIQIIAMNFNEFSKLLPSLMQERFARRILFQHLKEPFIKYANLNIQINHITNNIQNNNHINFVQAKAKEQEHIEDTIRSMRECYEEHNKGYTIPTREGTLQTQTSKFPIGSVDRNTLERDTKRIH